MTASARTCTRSLALKAGLRDENGKGVLVAPTVHGNLIVGPNAEPVAGDNTACTAAGLAFVSAAARRSVPDIRFGESIRNFAGVRANVDTGAFRHRRGGRCTRLHRPGRYEIAGPVQRTGRCQRGGPHSGRPRGSACGRKRITGTAAPGCGSRSCRRSEKAELIAEKSRLWPRDLPV